MLAPLIIIFSVAVLYWRTGQFDFINFDDDVYITNNPVVAHGLSWDGIRWAFSTTLGGHWHPLSWLSHMLDVSLFGMVSGPPHLENALLHAVNGCLLYCLVSERLKNKKVALLSSLIFVVHPLRVESVAWLAERKDVLSMFFGLGAMVQYRRQYALSLLCFALALLAKPTMVTLPFLLLLLEPNTRAELRAKFPFLALAAISIAVTIWAQAQGGGLRSVDEMPFSLRVDLVTVGYLTYLGKLIYPFGLSIFHPMVRFPSGLAAGAFMALAMFSWWCWSRRREQGWWLQAWIWFLITLAPMVGFVTVGGQVVADRWTYLPHIGLIVACVYSFTERYPKVASLALPALILGLSTLTWNYVSSWQNTETVFAHALAVNPANFMAHNNLGVLLAHSGRRDEALYHYQEAVRLNPTYPEALNNLGTQLAETGQLNAALGMFEKALQIRPGFEVAAQNRALALQDLARTQRGTQ